jgi:uncharacterized protein
MKKKPAHQVRQYKTYRAMPWRNGHGITLEIAREPARGEEFAWRLSLADIDTDGEFSAYPGYRRALVLVTGTALQLRFRGHGNCLLDPSSRGARFEGDWATHCAIPKGRCTDLSLIVRKGLAAAPASVVRAPKILHLKSSGHVALAANLYGALFVLEGAVAVTVSIGDRPRIVHARDTLLLSAGSRRMLTVRNLERSAAQLVFLSWRPGRRARADRLSGPSGPGGGDDDFDPVRR